MRACVAFDVQNSPPSLFHLICLSCERWRWHLTLTTGLSSDFGAHERAPVVLPTDHSASKVSPSDQEGDETDRGLTELSASDWCTVSMLDTGQHPSGHFRVLCSGVAYARRKVARALRPIPTGGNSHKNIFTFLRTETYVAQILLDNIISSIVACIHDEGTPILPSPTRRRRNRDAR